jgi:hypothetical protein
MSGPELLVAPSGATSRLALPYPIPDDSVDVPRDIQALAAKLDALTALKPAIVSSLPVSPVDGDECYFQTSNMANAGVVWHLRYRAAISDSSKWEFLGGMSLQAQTNNTSVFSNGAGWKRFPAPLQVPLPVKGVYFVRGQTQLQIGATFGGISIGIGTDTNPTPAPSIQLVSANITAAGSLVMAISGSRTFDPVTENYVEITVNLNSVTAVTPWYRTIELQPIRLG